MTRKIPTRNTGLDRRTLLAGTASLMASPLVVSRAQARAINIGIIMPLSGAP